MIEIKPIDYKTTFNVRHPVLRFGQPLESCFFEGDDLKSTVHFGLFFNSNLVGVVSVFQKNNSIFSAENQFQIRGMAVLKSCQGKGYGKLLLNQIEEYVKTCSGEIIWFNAREIALSFYSNFEYQIEGKPFEIPLIGTHYLMYKKLGCSL